MPLSPSSRLSRSWREWREHRTGRSESASSKAKTGHTARHLGLVDKGAARARSPTRRPRSDRQAVYAPHQRPIAEPRRLMPSIRPPAAYAPAHARRQSTRTASARSPSRAGPSCPRSSRRRYTRPASGLRAPPAPHRRHAGFMPLIRPPAVYTPRQAAGSSARRCHCPRPCASALRTSPGGRIASSPASSPSTTRQRLTGLARGPLGPRAGLIAPIAASALRPSLIAAKVHMRTIAPHQPKQPILSTQTPAIAAVLSITPAAQQY
jgi:hypothetical protein